MCDPDKIFFWNRRGGNLIGLDVEDHIDMTLYLSRKRTMNWEGMEEWWEDDSGQSHGRFYLI